MDKDTLIIIGAFFTVLVVILVYLAFSGTIDIDWNGIFNVKTYPKN